MSQFASVTFHAFDTEQMKPVSFEVGDEVPDHIASTVGEHVLTGDAPETPDADDTVTEPGLAVNPDAGTVEATLVPAAAGDAGTTVTEGPLTGDENLDEVVATPVAPLYDPTVDGETVAKVLAHLERSDEDERERVLALERKGQARKGILGTD